MPDSLCSRSSEFLSLSCSCSRQSTSEILPSSEEMEVEEGQRVRQWKGGRWRGRVKKKNQKRLEELFHPATIVLRIVSSQGERQRGSWREGGREEGRKTERPGERKDEGRTYRRIGFNCENLIIANCEFF